MDLYKMSSKKYRFQPKLNSISEYMHDKVVDVVKTCQQNNCILNKNNKRNS